MIEICGIFSYITKIKSPEISSNQMIHIKKCWNMRKLIDKNSSSAETGFFGRMNNLKIIVLCRNSKKSLKHIWSSHVFTYVIIWFENANHHSLYIPSINCHLKATWYWYKSRKIKWNMSNSKWRILHKFHLLDIAQKRYQVKCKSQMGNIPFIVFQWLSKSQIYLLQYIVMNRKSWRIVF